jgi:HSP20 family protein
VSGSSPLRESARDGRLVHDRYIATEGANAMNLIPKRKHNVPATRSSALTTPIADFRGEMDRLFDRFFRGPWAGASSWLEESGWRAGEFMPTVDLAENDKQITIRAELPGLEPEDVDINVSGNILTIHGEKKESKEDKGDDYYHCERRFGSFTRSVELPATADVESVEAEQRSGVLTIRVKKVPSAKARSIKVKPSQPQRTTVKA